MLLFVSAAWAAPCDPAALDRGAASLRSMTNPLLNPGLAAEALAEACELDAPLERALRDWSYVARMGGEAPGRIDRQVASLPAWAAACPGGVPPTGLVVERAELYDTCRLDQGVFGDRAAWSSGTGATVLPIVLGGLLPDNAKARTLLRALAGLPVS